MPTYKYSVFGVMSQFSRTDPDVLINNAPYVNGGPATGGSYGWTWRDTIEESVDDFFNSDFSGSVNPHWDRISYPVQAGGPLEVYLPSVAAEYAEYPYNIQMYNYAFTAFRNDGDPLYYTTLVIVSGLSEADAIPPQPEDPEDPEYISDVTIQLKRNDMLGHYEIKPSDASVLNKYYNPVTKIRAKFDTTRVAIIEETVDGGFMIYEEVASVPVSPVYVYTGKRRLQEIIDASYINQYKVTYT